MSSEWREYKLGEITTWLSGGTPKKEKSDFWNGDIPWMSASSMSGTRYHTSDLKLTLSGLASGSRLAPKDSVLLLVRGSALHKDIPVGVAMRELAFNQDVKAVIADQSKINPWYLLYWLLGKRDYLLGNVVEYTGIGAGKLDTKRMQDLPIQLPSLQEQENCIEIVKALDDRIALLRETNATLESIAQAIFKSWFIDFDPVKAKQQGQEPQGMDAATAALFPDAFQDSELGAIPAGWSVGRVENVLELSYGKALKATDRILGDIPVYGSGGIIGYHNKSLVNESSIIVGRKGTVGSLYWEDMPFFPIDTVYYVKGKMPLTYCYYLLETLGLNEMNTDAAVPGLNRNNVYRLPVIIPLKSLIEMYDSVIGKLRAKIRINKEKTQTLASIRDTLLPRLISGKLRLPEAEAMAVEALG